MASKKALAWGCGITGGAAVLVIAAVILFFAYASQDVKGVGVSVEGPTDAIVGQTFELNVVVTNERPRAALGLTDVDIAERYLAGFTVARIDPKPKSSMHVPLDNSRSFTFDVRVPPHDSRTFKFTLRAEKPGIYRGDVDVCEGVRFITGMAQTAVKEKE